MLVVCTILHVEFPRRGSTSATRGNNAPKICITSVGEQLEERMQSSEDSFNRRFELDSGLGHPLATFRHPNLADLRAPPAGMSACSSIPMYFEVGFLCKCMYYLCSCFCFTTYCIWFGFALIAANAAAKSDHEESRIRCGPCRQGWVA